MKIITIDDEELFGKVESALFENLNAEDYAKLFPNRKYEDQDIFDDDDNEGIIEDVTGMVRREFDYGAYEEEGPFEYYTVGGEKDDYALSRHEGEYVRRIIIKLPYPKTPLCPHCVQPQLWKGMTVCTWCEGYPKVNRCEHFKEARK